MAYPGAFSDIRTAVIDKARLDPVNDATRVGDWINSTYGQVVAETRCLQKKGVWTATTADAGISSYTLDASVLEVELVTCTPSGGQAWFPLKQTILDDVLNQRAVASTATGPPRTYTLIGLNQLEFWPALRAGDTLSFYFAYAADPLVADSDVPLLPEPYASKTLEFGALVQAAEWKRDLMMLGEFQQQYQTWIAAFQRYVNRKAGAYPAVFPTWVRPGPYGFADVSTDIPDVYLNGS